MKQEYLSVKVEAVIEVYELLDQISQKERDALLEIQIKTLDALEKLVLFKRLFFDLIEADEYQSIQEIIRAAP